MKPVLRKGNKGVHVETLQKLLNNASATQITPDKDFGPATDRAVRAFQTSAGLVPDGIVGQKTWLALANIPTKKKIPTPQSLLADIAKKYIGVKETGDNLAGDSKELLAIFKADTLEIKPGQTDGYPWCAAFVSFCVQKLLSQSSFYAGTTPPREASVSRFLNIWAKNNHCLIFPPSSNVFRPQKGDILVFTFSHIGIVESVNGNTMTTIEGNTNDAGSREGTVVARKSRPTSIIKSFIRLPISTIKLNSQLEEISRMC